MNIIISPVFFIRLMVLLNALWLAACDSPRMPDDVAQDFWQAVSLGDETTVKLYCTEFPAGSTIPDISLLKGTQAAFDELRINGDVAEIDTRLTMNGQSQPLYIVTVLVKNNQMWRVDLGKTMSGLPLPGTSAAASGLLKRWEAMGRKFSDDMGRAMDQFEQEIPRMQESIRKFGDAVQSDIEQTWRQKAPQIRQELDDLSSQIEQAIGQAAEELKKKKQEIYPSEQPEPNKGAPETYI